MTEYEISELMYSLIDSMATVFAVYLTILSGYLIMAYLVGRTLSSAQAITVNSLYIAITSVQVYSIFLYALEVGALLERKSEISELTVFQSLVSNQYSNFSTVLLMLLGVFASLYFFYATRRGAQA